MKIIVFIISAYLLFLFAIPCCLFDNCPEDKINTEQVSNHDSGDKDGCGNCSPFFVCEGCAAPVINFDFISFSIQPSENNSAFPRFIQHFISYNFSSIWQPPQLV